MSKKTLLNESTIRRFMKLAEIESLASPFLENAETLEEEDMEVDDLYEQDEEPTPEEAAYDEEYELKGMEDEAAMEDEDDLDLDVELEDEEDMDMEEDPMEELTQGLAAAIGDFLRDKMEDGTLELTVGEPAEEIDLEDEGDELEVDLEDEGDVLDVELDEKQGYDDREDESLGMEDGPEDDYEQSEEDRRDERYGKWGKRGEEDRHASLEESLVAEVARRVAKRILTAKKR